MNHRFVVALMATLMSMILPSSGQIGKTIGRLRMGLGVAVGEDADGGFFAACVDCAVIVFGFCAVATANMIRFLLWGEKTMRKITRNREGCQGCKFPPEAAASSVATSAGTAESVSAHHPALSVPFL